MIACVSVFIFYLIICIDQTRKIDGDNIVVKDLGPAFSGLRNNSSQHHEDSRGFGGRGGGGHFGGLGRGHGRREGPGNYRTISRYAGDDTLPLIYPCFCIRTRGETVTLLPNWASESTMGPAAMMARILESKMLMRWWRNSYSLSLQALRSDESAPIDVLKRVDSVKAGTSIYSTFVKSSYREYLRIRNLPAKMKVVRSRPGIDILISTAPAEVNRETRDLPCGPLTVGAVLSWRSARGN